MTRMTFPERTITSEPKRGQKIQVEVPTHIAGTLRFATGAVGTMITSFDIPAGHTLPDIEIYGTKGTLQVPNPNNFSGSVRVQRAGQREWREVDVRLPYSDNARGVGVLDMATRFAMGACIVQAASSHTMSWKRCMGFRLAPTRALSIE